MPAERLLLLGQRNDELHSSVARPRNVDRPIEQIRYRSNLGSEFLATFDGVVLEIFGPTAETGSSPESRRFHRDLMTITMEEPDRKGNLIVEVYAGTSPSRAVPSCQVRITERDRPVIEFFGRVHAALPPANARVADAGA